jgi:hypothetical protein
MNARSRSQRAEYETCKHVPKYEWLTKSPEKEPDQERSRKYHGNIAKNKRGFVHGRAPTRFEIYTMYLMTFLGTVLSSVSQLYKFEAVWVTYYVCRNYKF